MKSLTPATAGARRRREITEPLPDGELETFRNAPGPIGQRRRILTGSRLVAPLFEARTHRRTFPVELDGSRVGEVVLDETTIPIAGQEEPVQLSRVEVEVQAEPHPDIEDFVEALQTECDLKPAVTSKYEAGLDARGLQPAGAPNLGSTVVDASLSIGQTAFAVLRKHFGALLAHEPGTRLGEDPEELHDMRVASRRLRAAMSMFKESLPQEAGELREELRWVASALGKVRDLDVQLAQLDAWLDEADPEDADALGTLASLLADRRAQAREEMLQMLDSQRYGAFVSAFTEMLQAGPDPKSPVAATPVLQAAPDLITRRYRQLRKAGDGIHRQSPPEEYHELRIRGKRLRYALEFLSDVYGKPTRALIVPLVELQDLLGAHQDAHVAIDLLRGLSADESVILPPQAVFVMGGIAQRYRAEAVELRKRFPKAYAKLKGKSWKQMQKAMESR